MKRGEIYLVDLGPGVGYEASGIRPVVVVSNDVNNLSPLVVLVVPAVPTSDTLATIGIRVPAVDSGYAEDIAVIERHPRALDASRFPNQPSGGIPDSVMAKIEWALVVELDLKP